MSVRAEVFAEVYTNLPMRSTRLEEVMDEGESRGSKGRRRATCAGLGMNSR